MNKYVLDSCIWLDYLNGEASAEQVKGMLQESKNEIITHKVTLAEVVSVAKRRGYNADIAFNAITTLSHMYEGDVTFCKEVGLLHAERRQKIPKFSLADAFVVMTAKKMRAKIVTSDTDFLGQKDVLMFK